MSRRENEKLRKAIQLLEAGDVESIKKGMRMLYKLAGVAARYQTNYQPGVLSVLDNISTLLGGEPMGEES